MRGRLLLAGALTVETLPLVRRLERVRPLSASVAEGELFGRPVVVALVGVGAEKSERGTRAALELAEVDGVVSFGTCGSLDDGLLTGTVVTGSHLIEEQDGEPREALPLPGLRRCGVVTVREAVVDVERRAALRQRGAEVCEMEAVGVHRAAEGRPFAALKVVSDQAGAAADDPFSVPSVGGLMLFQARALRVVEEGLVPVLARLLRA